VILAEDGGDDSGLIAVGGYGAGKADKHTPFEGMKKIGLIEPDKIDLTTGVFKGGDLDVFVGFGVDVFEKSNATVDSDVLVLLYL